MKNEIDFSRTAIMYVRDYSKERTNTYKVNEQEDIIRKYTQENELRIIGFFKDEGSSGKNFNRMGFQKMLEFIEFSSIRPRFLVVIDFGRLTTSKSEERRLRDFLKRKNLRVISLVHTMLKQR